jgi:hypothetical protein
MFLVYFPAPVYERSVKETGADVYDITAQEDRNEGLE